MFRSPLRLLPALCLLAACQFDPSTTMAEESIGGPSVDAGAESDATVQLLPALHCQDVLDLGRSDGDGIYTIDPDGEGGEPAFDAYCDMTTDGGGWTLVYAYTFTDYGNYTSGGNAVTPRPTWTLSNDSSAVPTSTTAPLGLGDFAALDFPRWKEIGGSFHVRSNINHWLICDEGTGSLVQEVEGSLSCRLEQQIATACTNDVPSSIVHDWGGRGPALNGNAHYYFWVGTTDGYWPTHDPCGNNQANHLTGVGTPSGSIFLR